MTYTIFLSRTKGDVSFMDSQAAITQANSSTGCPRRPFRFVPIDEIRTSRNRSRTRLVELWRLGLALCFAALFAVRASGQVSHTIHISNDADDGYYNVHDNSGWHADPQTGGADLVGSDSTNSDAWVVGYRFPAAGINSGDTIRSAYIEVVSSDGSATSTTCGSAPCPDSGMTFRVYGVAQDDGPSFSNTAGNTPLDVPYSTSYDDYTTTGPGDVHGSCQGNNNGQNTCIHIIDVTNIVKEITSRPGWTNTSAMRFVLLSTSATSNNVYAGFEDYSANPARAAALLVNPGLPTVVSSGGWGTSPSVTYATTYVTGPFVYPNASTLLLFLGDYYNFYGQTIGQPTVTDSCGNGWNILAGPTDWPGINYYQRGTVYYVQNPQACPTPDTITVNVPIEEPIFLHFLALAGSNTGSAPVASAITSPAPDTATTTAPSAYITLGGAGLLVNWIFGDADPSHVFTPQAGFTKDLDSTPTYLTAVTENVLTSGSYQNTFTITPNPDGWQTVMIGVPASSATAATPTMTVTPSLSSMTSTQPLTVTVTVSGTPTPTGTVALIGGGYTSTVTTLASGIAAINIPSGSLNAGTDTLTVEYSPDATSSSIYNSVTGTATVTVTAATPTVTVTPGASSVTTTQPLSVTVAVSGGAGSPAPTGTVVLSGGGYTSAATTLSSGSASINIPAGTLSVGIYTFQASYMPDTNSSGIYNLATGAPSSQVTVTTATPTVTVTPSPSSITTTQALSVTVAVSGGLGNPTPTGTVTLSGGGYTSAATTLSGGSTTISIPAGSLTLGTDTLTASYTPDTNGSLTYNSASGSGPVIVSKTTPTVTVSPSPSNITTTQPTTVTVTVAGTPTPTGSVTLSSGTYTSAPTTLSGGSASINVPAGSLSAGTDTLTATYTPDSGSSSTYNSATGTSSETVITTTPTVTVTPGASSVSTTQPLSVTVAVSGGTGNPIPAGNVTLSGNGYTSAATALSGGTVTINIPAGKLGSGNYTFNATYTPDSASSPIYAGALGTASSSVSVTVSTPTVTVTPGASSISTTQPLSVTVTVDGGTGIATPTGSVTLTGGSYTSAATTLSGGTATINIPAAKLSAGSYTFNASYTPDSNSSSTYGNASGTASSALTVSTTAPTVTVTPGVSSITTTQPLTVTVVVGAGTGNPTATGSVILSSGSYTSAAITLTSGAATINIPANTLPAGSYTFKAAYTPDTTSSPIYGSASGTASSAVTVNTAVPAVTVTPSASNILISQPLSVTVTVSGGSGNPAPTGTVILSGGSYTSAATGLGAGTATINIPGGTLNEGNYSFKASYTPDATSSSVYASASGTASTNVIVAVAAPTVTVTPVVSSITTTQPLMMTVTVGGGTGSPTATGSVTLTGGSYTSAPTALTGGTATINIPANVFSVGSYTFKATYTPDSNSSSYYIGASGIASTAVNVGVAAPTVTVVPGASSITTTQPLTVTVTVSGGTGSPTATGSVILTGGSYTSAATALTGGTATINIPANVFSVGSYTFKATYTPDATGSLIYGGASGTASTATTVAAATPSVTVTPGASSVSTAQPLSVTVAMSGGTGNPVPTGTVTLSGGSYTSAATALSAGSATINILANALSVGSYTFKATYTPDATSVPIYAGASGTASTAVNVVAPTYTMSATTVTVAPGGSGSSTVTVSSTNGYTGTITLTCAITAEPSGATDLPGCTGGQVNLTSGTSAQGTVTLSTTAPSAALERPMLGPGKGWAGGGGAVLAVVLFFWLPIRRKTWRATFGVLLGLVLLGSLLACGGKSNNNNQNSNPGTTAGSYTITITGTGSDSAKTPATTTFVLTVS